MINQLVKLLAPLRSRIANMVARAVLNTVNDATQVQAVNVTLLAQETRDAIERFQNYGFTSVPLAGAEAVAIFVDGRREHGFVIAIDDRRYRMKNLVAGEVAIYTDQGDSVVIKRGGTINVTASTKVHVSSPLVEMTGDVHVTGILTADRGVVSGDDVDANGVSLRNHIHDAGSGTLVAPNGPVTGTTGGPI